MSRLSSWPWPETLGKREEVEVGAPIIKANSLAKRYISIDRGVVKAVDNVSLEVNEGEIFGLVGVSGGGKTTLSKMVSGIITPTGGSISVRVGDDWVDMTVLGSNGRGRATKYIGILHQEYTLYPSRSVIENLTEAIGLSLPFELAERKAIHTLETVGFTEEQAEAVLDQDARRAFRGREASRGHGTGIDKRAENSHPG